MATLQEFVARVPGFTGLPHAQRIKHFVWFLQSVRGQPAATVTDIRNCYETAHIELPGNLARSIEALTEKNPPDLLKQAGAYRLHAKQRHAFDAQYGQADSVLEIEQTLAALPAKLKSESERLYLEETLTCY